MSFSVSLSIYGQNDPENSISVPHKQISVGSNSSTVSDSSPLSLHSPHLEIGQDGVTNYSAGHCEKSMDVCKGPGTMPGTEYSNRHHLNKLLITFCLLGYHIKP